MLPIDSDPESMFLEAEVKIRKSDSDGLTKQICDILNDPRFEKDLSYEERGNLGFLVRSQLSMTRIPLEGFNDTHFFKDGQYQVSLVGKQTIYSLIMESNIGAIDGSSLVKAFLRLLREKYREGFISIPIIIHGFTLPKGVKALLKNNELYDELKKRLGDSL